MRQLYLLIFSFVFFACGRQDRQFFQSLKVKHAFLDTFSQFDLKGFGISNKSIEQRGKSYYNFNAGKNSVFIGGFFRRESNIIYFLPRDAEKELIFFDIIKPNLSSDDSGRKVITQTRGYFEIVEKGSIYNALLNDTTYLVEINGNGLVSESESLIFEINEKFDIVNIKHVNCRNDTLTMVFQPDEKVFYANRNDSVKCL
jgi:hypothetical protein